MAHHHSLDELSLQGSWLTIGVFDGVHLGHQDLLRRLVTGAQETGLSAIAVTFYPHPAVVLGRQADFQYLTLPGEKAGLLEQMGIEHVITLPFDRALAGKTAGQFMQMVGRALGVKHLLVGYDFALGRNREGNAARLKELGESLGYSTVVIPPYSKGDTVISSSAIRTLLQSGQVAEAAALLGRFYRVSGPVVHGDGRGRHINMPTANIAYPPEKLIPAYGIYATWAWLDGKRFAAATNIGINPTFTPERTNTSLEAHLLDFHGDLYGRELSLEFVARLRGEQKFDSVPALIDQIQSDIVRTRKLLESSDPS